MTRYRDQTFIICLDDDLDDYHLTQVIDDIALLVDMRIKIAIVTNSSHLAPSVIDQEEAKRLRMAGFEMASRVVARLSLFNKTAVMGNWTSAQGHGVVEGIDYGYAGTVNKFEIPVLQTLLKDMIVPVLPALGWSRTGKEYILNAYQFSLSLFEKLKAKKLCFVFGEQFSSEMEVLKIPPIESIDCNEAGQMVRLTPRGVKALLKHNKQNENKKESAPLAVPSTYPMLLQHAAKSLQKNNERIHFLSGLNDGALLVEIFDNLGAGTMLYTDEFEAIRPMTLADVEAVYRIMLPLVEKKILLPRELNDLKRGVNDYFVSSVDELIQGAVGIYAYGDREAEIGALAVATGYEQLGLGKKLVNFAIKTAQERAYTRLFALTTTTGDWFEQLGFVRGTIDLLPKVRKKHYLKQARNSRIYYYEL